MKNRPWISPKGGKNYRGTTLIFSSFCALTGAPGNAYLSTFRLPDHLQPASIVPLCTNRGSLTASNQRTLLFIAFFN